MISQAGKGGIAQDAANLATEQVGMHGGLAATLLSAVAVVFSGYSLWDTSLKAADLRVFVPRVIYYAAPYQNSNFEMISIPVTLLNDGARTATALEMDLAVTDPRTKATKHFYAAEFGVWSMERTRDRAYTGFAPIPLEGRSSRTESVLFYTRGEEEKPEQLIREVGPYQFTLTIRQAEDSGLLWTNPAKPISVSFERELPFYDARSFESGTIFMPAKDWQSTSSTPAR